MLAKLIAHVKRLWSAAPVATAILALALAASLFFVAHGAFLWLGRPPIAEREQPVAAWMTPRYVARSWHVPREVVMQGLGMTRPLPDGPMNLAEIAERKGVPVDTVIQDLESAIAAFRASKAPPRPEPTQ